MATRSAAAAPVVPTAMAAGATAIVTAVAASTRAASRAAASTATPAFGKSQFGADDSGAWRQHRNQHQSGNRGHHCTNHGHVVSPALTLVAAHNGEARRL